MARRVIADTERVGEFVMARMPFGPRWTNYKAIGIERDGVVVAGVVYEGMSRCDVNIHSAVDDPSAVNFEWMFTMFDYPFNQCGLTRVTGLVPRSNQKVITFDVDKVGFKVEGIARKALPDGDDIVILGMLKDECKWIRRGKRK